MINMMTQPCKHPLLTVLLCIQAKAAMVDRVFETYRVMVAKGFKPDEYSISTLLDACARGKQMLQGQECFDRELALHKIKPTVVSWNGLLGVYQQAGNMVCSTLAVSAISHQLSRSYCCCNCHMEKSSKV